MNTNDKSKQIEVKSQKRTPKTQKEAIQRLLKKHFGHFEIEKKFDWLKTPTKEKLPEEYFAIVEALSQYRNQTGFRKSNYQPHCDIVLDTHKLIIEYDENQHFSKARQITLENYPANINLHFSKSDWISACEKINARDNDPIDRDEKRAFYDTVRDIEAHKNGYKLVRIKHGDIDWEADGAEEHLKKLIDGGKRHKIARLVVTGKQYDEHGNPIYSELEKLIEKFLSSEYNNKTYEFILTPGGFLTFDFPDSLQHKIDISDAETKAETEKDADAEKQYIPLIQEGANSIIVNFFKGLNSLTFQRLKETADYFTIGIDGSNRFNQRIELVAVYDLKKEEVIRWTGKFYPTPTEVQKRNLITIKDLETHFSEMNNQKIVILGCHDLNVFSPRGQAVAKGCKKKLADKFKTKCEDFRPEIILQHPHTTDTPNIWNLPWRTVKKELLSVKHFASGIKYYNKNGVRADIKEVLEKTKSGDVIDFYYD